MNQQRRIVLLLVIFTILGVLFWAIRGGLVLNGFFNELGWW